ncbi:MAG: transcriptional repressor [Acidimicrobiales bacterium]|jgi:Fur family ferric uptake transcriptional regulator
MTRWHSDSVAGTTSEQATFGGASRHTRQRRAVLAALGQSGSFRSAQVIHASIRQTGEKIGLATVYRALKMLSDAGDIDVVRDDAGEQLYRRCGTSHHHHLVCVSCGTAVEVESAPMERWAVKVGEAHGFSDVWHSLEVFGTCTRCANDPERTTEGASR